VTVHVEQDGRRHVRSALLLETAGRRLLLNLVEEPVCAGGGALSSRAVGATCVRSGAGSTATAHALRGRNAALDEARDKEVSQRSPARSAAPMSMNRTAAIRFVR
jgi:hypothetical protein